MMTIPRTLGTIFGGAGRACARGGQVDAELVSRLQEHGFEDPITHLCDPRLDYPELLLLSGYHWEETPEGSRYTYRCADERYSQSVEYGSQRRLVTRCLDRVQRLVVPPPKDSCQTAQPCYNGLA